MSRRQRGLSNRRAARRNVQQKDLLSLGGKNEDYRIQRISTFYPLTFGFPDRLISKLRYHASITKSSVLGAQALQQFRWNSTYDPDYTNVGHQPLYRDTFASIYDQYAVIKAHAVVTFVNISGDDWTVGVGTDDDVSPASVLDTICEQNHSFHKRIGFSSGGPNQQTFKISWDCRSYLGIDPFTSETYKTPVGSDPTEVSFLNCFGYNMQGPGASNIQMDITLEQEVLWTELSTPSQS